MMKLKDLKQAVKELAGKGKYHSSKHEITEYHDGDTEDRYAAYIEDIGWTKGHTTPEEVLEEMKQLCSTSK